MIQRLALAAAYRTTASDLTTMLGFIFENVLDQIAPLSAAVWSSEYADGWKLRLSAGSQMPLPQGYSSWIELNQASILLRRAISIQIPASQIGSSGQIHWVVPSIFPGGSCYVFHVLAVHDPGLTEAIEPFLATLAHLIVNLGPSQVSVATPIFVPTDCGDASLTPRQKEVLRLLALDLTYSQIALRLGFSESTVKQEAMKIFKKLGVANRIEAVKKI